MSQLFELLFGQYSAYQSIDIALEVTAVVFGFLSVWYAKKNHIWVFPTGLISTSIFVYLLWKWALLGDMMINAYYFVMSIYGWYVWTRKTNDQATPISQTNAKEKRTSVIIFIITLVFVYVVYQSAGKWTTWTAYVDTFTTAIFFVGMWLMARRKIENWIFWIVGDIISVPLYFYKGLTFTSLQYLIFTIIAIYGFLAWKHVLTNSKATA
ncbi:MAG: Nicotinamide riboside transporter PnuC [Bacteroidota bacterium]|nr:MAG: Nicotinamide riboside transporter PnuC [Bacteroidota bacterium]